MPSTSRLSSPVAASLIVSAAILGGTSLYATARLTPAAAAPAPVSIALVDISRLIGATKESQDRSAEIRKKFDEISKSLNQTQMEMDKIKNDLETKIPKNDYRARQEAVGNFKELEAVKDARLRTYQNSFEITKGDITHELYDKALAAIEQFAKGPGDNFDLILVDDRNVSIPMGALHQEFERAAVSRKLLYARQGLDITDRIITLMDTAYTTANPNRPATPDAAPGPTAPR